MKELLAKIKQKVHLTVSLTLALVFLLFILQNFEQTQASFLFWTISIPRAVMLLGTLLLGIIIGVIAMIGKQAQKNLPLRQLTVKTMNSRRQFWTRMM